VSALPFFFALASFLYATVGQAGGTAFLAIMAFGSFKPNEMRPTALLLNIVAATYSTYVAELAGGVMATLFFGWLQQKSAVINAPQGASRRPHRK
jgi:hypothetical protein